MTAQPRPNPSGDNPRAGLATRPEVTWPTWWRPLVAGTVAFAVVFAVAATSQRAALGLVCVAAGAFVASAVALVLDR